MEFLRWWEGFVGMGVGMGMRVEGGWYVFVFLLLHHHHSPSKVLTRLQLPTNAILLASSLSSTILSIIALALQATLNHQSPQRDTLQTWTCMWKNVQGEGVPQSFDTLCHETVSSTFTSQNQKRK